MVVVLLDYHADLYVHPVEIVKSRHLAVVL
jgi:hypothetical protein